ncbi:MAG: hypothetical protein ABIR96_07320 [Bdellovibrionota bacterium]
METPTPDTSAPMRVSMKIIWATMLGSQVILLHVLKNYPSIVDVGAPAGSPSSPISNAQILPFYAVALVDVAASFIVPRMLYRSLLKQGTKFPIYTPYIVRLALTEAIGLLGFVAGTMMTSFTVAIPFFVVSILLYLKMFPSDSRFREWNESKNF